MRDRPPTTTIPTFKAALDVDQYLLIHLPRESFLSSPQDGVGLLGRTTGGDDREGGVGREYSVLVRVQGAAVSAGFVAAVEVDSGDIRMSEAAVSTAFGPSMSGLLDEGGVGSPRSPCGVRIS